MPKFKVIRASAGSGKTFNLTREYLKLLFADTENFKHVLAVTFTNKATEEMKSRIIGELYALSANQPSGQLNALMDTCMLSEKQVRSRATVILKKLLHNYSHFSVSTIDTFFQRIIRNFTRELGIQGGYSIELDTEALLDEAFKRLLVQAETDQELLNWLTRFAESLIENGDNWNFEKSIRNLGREIFNEKFKSIDDNVLELFSERRKLQEFMAELHAICRDTEKTYREFGKKASAVIEASGLTVDDFSRKGSGPAGFLMKLVTGAFREPTAIALGAATSVEKWYTATSSHKNEIIQVAGEKLMPIMQQVTDYYNNRFRQYFTASVVLRNLFTLGILSDLSKMADSWCTENNSFLLPEAPVFLNRIMDDNDTPFIYEKAGCWYHHFMIDEFQDLSMMQWLNFKPLISNSLSQDFHNLAVGDAKQSIYRWRNSSWEILEKHIDNDFPQEVIEPVTLKENWRSKENIIRFNNHFFSNAAKILQEEYNQVIANEKRSADGERTNSIAGLYESVEQSAGIPDNAGGYVQVEFVNQSDEAGFVDTTNQRIVEVLCDVQDKGYRLNDIAILTRTNSEAKMMADFLMTYANQHPDERHRFDVISDEAMRLGNSALVNTLMALLQHIIKPEDLTNNYLLCSFLSNYLKQEEPEAAWFNPETGDYANAKRLLDDLPLEYGELVLSRNSFSLIEIIEKLISIFGLNKFSGEHIYLQALRDLSIEFSRKSGGDLARFIEYWHEKGKEKSVSAPSGQDAIRILTLHKSKGLEFKITILPYCTWELKSSRSTYLWCKSGHKPFDRIPTLPVSFSSQLINTYFEEDYYTEVGRQYIDNLNLLYVSFTRAKEALYVFCRYNDKGNLKNVSDLSANILGTTTYTLGELKHNETASAPPADELLTYGSLPEYVAANRIKIAFQGRLMMDSSVDKPSRPLNTGRILHEVFMQIKSTKGIAPAVDRLFLQGRITSPEKDKYLHIIDEAIKDPVASDWFTDDWTVLNEAEIILPKGKTKRPDRVMRKGDRSVVIDYKFGINMESQHEKQVKEYAGLLSEMGYKNTEAYLWYVTLGKVVECNV
ncbi:MAG: UvrD-helicase domain-containing protein [Bacteroidales bacterium]|nr:UvrD-helicase domain-containing protein [Bacteroidales bacterium]